jgi:hypothetical protein
MTKHEVLPFAEHKEENVHIRTFSSLLGQDELVWHRDPEDRWVWCEHKTDWGFQIDNMLPVSFDAPIFVPNETYHRVIKGTGDVTLCVLKCL